MSEKCVGCGNPIDAGVLCEDCRDHSVCHCGLGIEDHTYPGAAEHSFVPRVRVNLRCEVCGRGLIAEDLELNTGMCWKCHHE